MQHRIRHSISIANMLGQSSSFSWSSYWAKQSNFYELWKVTGTGNLVGMIKGDTLTVGGSVGSYTFQVPNTAPYQARDEDFIWFKTSEIQRTTTEAELVGYDFAKTIVKYSDVAPYTIEYIGILDTGQSVNDRMYSDFHLSRWWSGTLNLNGYSKGNRGLARSVFDDLFDLLNDGNTVGYFDPLDVDNVWRIVNSDHVYWDMMYGKNQRSAEIATGVLIPFAVYEITATEVNHFGAGYLVGNSIVAPSAIALDANNKVKRILGNHLTKHTSGFPQLRIFDGISHSMRTAPIADLVQPENIYLIIKQISWTSGDYIQDGATGDHGMLYQGATTPGLKVYSGALSGQNNNLAIGDVGIARILFNGANSIFQINNTAAITGNFGTDNMGTITLGCYGNMVLGNANIEFQGGIYRKVADSSVYDIALRKKLSIKFSVTMTPAL
jgi:hypothetical protein